MQKTLLTWDGSYQGFLELRDKLEPLGWTVEAVSDFGSQLKVTRPVGLTHYLRAYSILEVPADELYSPFTICDPLGLLERVKL